MKPLLAFLCVATAFLTATAGKALGAHAMEPAVSRADEDAMITVRGQLGVLSGEAHEIVYGGKDLPGLEDYKISELIWDLERVVMAGAVVSVGGCGPLVLNVGLWMGVNEGVDGEMYDFDWLDPSRSDWTDRSRSEVDVISAIMFDANLSLELSRGDGYSLSGVAGVMYDFWEWDDRGQEFTYTVDSFRDTTGTFGGQNVIDYEQTFLIPYIGVEAALDLGGLSLQGWVLYSSVVAASDEDHHILRELHFEETFEGGEYIAYGVAATFDLDERLFVQGSFERQEVMETVGDLKIVELDVTSSDAAGISHEATMISVSLGVRL